MGTAIGLTVREREDLARRQREMARRRRLELEEWEQSRADALKSAGRRSASTDDGERPIEEWTRDELYARAKDLGIDRRSAMSKRELVHALRVY
ncbi:MAG: Rho termination factor [Acidimicrobiia bacterium]